jgi:hypothetical protein
VCGSPTDVDIIEFDTTRIDDRGVYRDIVRMTATVVARWQIDSSGGLLAARSLLCA